MNRRVPTETELRNVKRIHLTAVCGTGMGSLAGLLKEKGYQVTGSDKDVYPPMSTQLEKLGIPVQPGYDGARLAGVDLGIIGNAVSRGNPELERALEMDLPLLSLPEALQQFFLKQRTSIVVTGTHGKTTTSALMSFLLERSGKDPGFFVGGILANYGQSCRLNAEGGYFVVEGDEYDSACFDKRPKIVHYLPQAAILTSIEFDHADIYRDLEHVKSAFRDFIAKLSPAAALVVSSEDENIQAVLAATKAKVISYGLDAASTFRGAAIEEGPGGLTFDLYRGKEKVGRFRSPLLGTYNLKNLLAVLAVLDHFAIPLAPALAALPEFRNVFRRQQVRGVERGVTVIDDFAHHPTAVRVTLQALRKGYPQGRLWAVFEPRTATSRRAVFQAEYAQAFEAADEVLIATVFKADGIAAEERFSSEKLVEDLKKHGKKARCGLTVDEMVATLGRESKPGDAIAVLSNGGFGGIHEKLLTALREAK